MSITKDETFQPAVKWTGSKRSISFDIVRRFPDHDYYYEPFVGGGSILYQRNPEKAICGDICEPLIGIWKIIRDNPDELLEYYRRNWQRLQDEGHEVYYEIRDEFNETRSPKHLFFLSRTCVNGLIRFNQDGEFNNSLHHTRPGIHPDRLAKIIRDWHKRISAVEFHTGDYEETTETASEGDFIYLDPPYFNVTSRYYGSIDKERFIDFLGDLNERDIRYALSLDGHSGDKDYTVELPDWAYEESFMLVSGKSSFKKVIDKKNSEVKEALYLNYDPAKFVQKQSKLENY